MEIWMKRLKKQQIMLNDIRAMLEAIRLILRETKLLDKIQSLVNLTYFIKNIYSDLDHITPHPKRSLSQLPMANPYKNIASILSTVTTVPYLLLQVLVKKASQ